MVSAKNEFDFLVNSYYQAYGLSRGIIASGIFGKIDLLPEIEKFRSNLKNTPVLYNAVIQGDNKGQRGKVETDLTKLKLEETFGLSEWWFTEIQRSVDDYSKANSDMASYRTTFQTASDALYGLIESVIPHMKPLTSDVDVISDVANAILNKNYWEGSEIIREIDFSRLFVTMLKYSDKWVYEYMKHLVGKKIEKLNSRDKFVLTAIEKKEIQGKTYVFQYVDFNGAKLPLVGIVSTINSGFVEFPSKRPSNFNDLSAGSVNCTVEIREFLETLLKYIFF